MLPMPDGVAAYVPRYPQRTGNYFTDKISPDIMISLF